MGFWGSLIHGAAEIADWVAKNSGTILSVAKVVKKVAGVVVSDEELLADGDNLLPELHNNLSTAEKIMKDLADKQFPFPKLEGPGMAAHIDGPCDLVALWPTPTTGKAPKVDPSIGVDVNKFLTLKKLPNVLGTGGNALDVGELVADYMFAENGPVSDVDGQLQHKPFSKTTEKGTTISGGNVYYKVPLGNAGTHKAWHMLTRIYHINSTQSLEELKQEKRRLAIQPQESKVDAIGPYNSTTISVQWAGTRDVASLMSKAVKKMQADSEGSIEKMKGSIVDGARHVYQFKTGTETGPGEVLAAFSKAISNTMAPPNDTHSLPRMPRLNIENMQTYIP